MKRRNKRHSREQLRRRLRSEPLEDRRLLAALDFLPSGGTVIEENGTSVVEVAPGETVLVAAQIVDSEVDVLGFQLNLSGSDAALALENFTNGVFPAVTDNTLDSSQDYYLVASGIFTGPLAVPPTQVMGTFSVTAPSTPADYVWTSNLVRSANDDTILSDITGAAIPITDFGDLIIRVTANSDVPELNVGTTGQDVVEDAGQVTVRAMLSQISDSDVTVPFSVSGTAIDGSDFTVESSPITVPAGANFADITVTISDDDAVEAAETVIVTLGTPTGATLGASAVHTINIEDNDISPSTGLSLDFVADETMATVTEENGQTVITVTPGSTVSVSALVLDSPLPVLGFQLNLSGSNNFLVLNNFANGDFVTATDDQLDSASNDFEVAAGVFPDPLTVPPNRLVGSFDVTAPTATGDYLLTANLVQGANNDTLFSDAAGNSITVNDFGDAIIRVAAPPPTVSLSLDAQSGSEDQGSLTVSVDLSDVSDADVTVPFTVTGTATDGSDYAITSSPITIAAGQNSSTISITLTDDLLDEPDETVVITLGDPTGATLGSQVVHTATIVDNDLPSISFDAAAQTVDENAGAVTVTASLSAVSDSDVSVQFTTSGSASSSSDFSIASNTITIPAGQTTGSATVTVTDDSVDEPNETIVLNLGVPTGATAGPTTVHTITITDNDEPIPPSVILTLDGQNVVESAGAASVTARLSSISDTDVTIPFTLSGSATEGSDFSISTNPLTIPAGQIAANITVTVTDDTLDEPDETVTVTLGTPTGATLGNRTTHTITINDNDLPPLPTVTLSSQAQTAAENAGDVTVTATLSSTSTTNVTVPLTITGTATDGSDFTIASSSVTIPAGQTSATISISILNDTADEPDETIIVTLNEPTGATLGAVTSHTVTVQDDDPPAGTPIVNFTTNSLTVAETSSVTMLTATLSIASEFDVSIPFSVSGTATDGSDFAVSSSPLIIPAGQTAASIEVTITEDTLDENDETVVVALQTPTGAVLGTETQRTITIADNDDPAPTPSVQFAATAQDAAENAGTVSVSVNLSNVADVDVTIPFSIAGDATAGDDFTVSTSPLTIPAGQTTGTINVSLIDDVILESTETISITLGTPTGGDLGANSVHVITINDDEFISNGDNRIIIPDFVARPHVVPGDGRPTAILFKALEDTVLTVTKVNTLSLTEEIIVLDQNLTPVGGPDNDGQFTANLNSQGLYAIILQGQSEESIFVVRSSEGFASLTGATTNILLPTDVNADGSSTSLDALLVINQLQRETLLEGEEIESQVARYYDVNRDGVVSATDVLRIINYMSRQSDQLAPGTNNADAEQVDDSPVDAAIATLSEVAAKIVSVDSGNATATSSVVVGSDPVDEVLSDESALDELLASLN